MSCPGSPGLSDAEHPADGPGAAQGCGDGPHRLPPGRGRHSGAGLGPVRSAAPRAAGSAPPRQHPDERLHHRRRQRAVPRRLRAGGAGPGVLPGGHPGHLPGLSRRDRGLCPRRPRYVLFRSVLHERPDRRPLRQPGPLRPALPPALRGQRPGQEAVSPESEGQLPGRRAERHGRHGRGLPEAGGPHEAAGVRGRHHPDLQPPAGRAPGPHPRRGGGAGPGLLPLRLHRLVLEGPPRRGDVRHPSGKRPGPQGAVCRRQDRL